MKYDIHKLRRDEKSKITDEEFLSSFAFREYLEDKARIIHKDFGIPDVRTIIFYDAKSEVTAYTENTQYVMNTGHPSIFGTRDEKFFQNLGVHFHEIGHRLFTNFTCFHSFQQNLLAGKFYPAEPTVDLLRRRNLEDLKQYMSDELQCRILQKIAGTLINCIEDGRIEELLLHSCAKYRMQYSGFELMRDRTYEHIQPLPEILKMVESEKLLPFEALERIILHYARFGEIKGLEYAVHKDEPIIKKFDAIQNALDKCLDALTAVSFYNGVNQLMVILWPEMKEYIEKVKDEIEEEMKKEKKDSGMSSNCNAGSSGDDGDILIRVAARIDERGQQIEGMTHAADENMSGDGSDNEQIYAILCDSDPSNGCNPNDTDYAVAGQKPPYTRTDRISDRGGSGKIDRIDNFTEASNAKMTMDNILNIIAEENVDIALEKQITKDLYAFKKTVDFTNVHKNVDCTIIRHKVEKSNIQEYEDIAAPIVEIAQKLAKKTDFFSEDETPVTVSGKYYGTKFNAASIARGDYRYFSKQYDLEEAPSLAVAVCIDESGSMCGEKCQAAKRLAIMLYEYCSILKIPTLIYGHTTKSDGVKMYCYTDYLKQDPNDRYRLMNVSSRNCNRDGYVIRFLKARLEEMPADHKLLFVISDGAPNDGSYTGTAAMADLQEITKDCDAQGITLISAAVGSDRDSINAIYGRNHFLDISDLSALPLLITNKIKSLLK